VERFSSLDAIAAPFAQSNIDTEQIIPARFLQKPRDGALGQYLFHDLRFGDGGVENPDFVLNQGPWREARILVADENFGCGSSRENAIWALYDHGFRAAIAPTFGDIFSNNGLKNGFLTVRLPAEIVSEILIALKAAPGLKIAIDLEPQTVALPDGRVHPFEIDPFAKFCLLNGFDELDYTLSRIEEIDAFERRYGREND
jgi:3-isopropylmalate/(R)-2-methylmalate dehydratase small subunit